MTSRDQFSFFHRLRVRWAELDPQGIVFNANYLMYFDIAMTEYMRRIGLRYQDYLDAFGTDMFAVNAGINFRNSAHYDDELDIGARVAQIGRTSFTFAMAVFRNDELLVDGSMIYVNADPATKKAAPLSQPFLDRILAFERTPPERKAQA